jgi:uncharacterized Zn-binding protein involved in type VI secretion
MPGFLLHLGALVQCKHQGQAVPVVTNSSVKVAGQPIVTMVAPYNITGCPLNNPCVSAQWISAATRIKSNGQPVLLQDSQSTCTPNATPLTILSIQQKVRGI